MYRLTFVIFLLGFTTNLLSQNPHGAEMKINCAACHTSAGWEIEAKFWQESDPEKLRISKMTGMELGFDSIRFHHEKTNFALKGRHVGVDCRACHESLVFSEAGSDCISCHADMHQQTVGTDCARCHTSTNWLVDNITELHQENGFPLTGVHKSVSCEECHISASTLQFNRIGNDCASCHLTDFNATTNPNHKQAGFSKDCLECHDPLKPGWETDKVNHDFFPLTKGHEISDCAKCHVGGDFSSTPTNCFACHQPDFEGATSPNHVQANFPNDCAVCHTTDLDWMPAQYTQHDAEFFPIYSGKHQGQWSSCVECHTNPSNFAEFSCTTCHINPETDDGHNGVNGYVYENSACLSCHPTGDADVSFDHNDTNTCVGCHLADYNGTNNPDHQSAGFPTSCQDCHTETAWVPSTWDHDQQYFPIYSGKHDGEWNQCIDCHTIQGNFALFSCIDCHEHDDPVVMADIHQGVPGYQYSSPACYSCHPDGED